VNEEKKKQMIAAVKEVAGVSKVKDDIGIVPPRAIRTTILDNQRHTVLVT